MTFAERIQVPVDYIKQQYEPEDRLAVALIRKTDDTSVVKQEFKTAKDICKDSYQAHLRAANAHGNSVYVTANSLHPDASGRTKNHVAKVRHVFLDIDQNGPEVLKKATLELPKPSVVMETSPERYQMIWKVKDFTRDQAERLVKQMAITAGADGAVWDSARILRLPGFRNCKPEANNHYVRIVPGERSQNLWTPADFPALKQEQTQQIRQTIDRRLGVPTTGQSVLSHRDWGQVLHKLENHEDPGKVEQWLLERSGRKPNPEYYAKLTVEKALKRMSEQPKHERGRGI